MGNIGSNSYIPMTVLSQELERLEFSKKLRKNPAEYSAYVNERVDSMTKEVHQTKQDAFKKSQIDLARYMDMDHNANFYRVRNKDVDRLTKSVAENNARIAEGIKVDKQNSKRQFEINEWYNQNKLETLFFLQLFFVSSLIMIILVSLQKRGTLSPSLAALFSGLLATIVIGVGVYRYYYTEGARDPRLWNRRRFGTIEPPPPAPSGDCPKEPEEYDDTYMNQIAAGIGACASDYASKAENTLDEIKRDMNEEAVHMAKTGRMSDFDFKGALNKVCPGDF